MHVHLYCESTCPYISLPKVPPNAHAKPCLWWPSSAAPPAFLEPIVWLASGWTDRRLRNPDCDCLDNLVLHSGTFALPKQERQFFVGVSSHNSFFVSFVSTFSTCPAWKHKRYAPVLNESTILAWLQIHLTLSKTHSSVILYSVHWWGLTLVRSNIVDTLAGCCHACQRSSFPNCRNIRPIYYWRILHPFPHHIVYDINT